MGINMVFTKKSTLWYDLRFRKQAISGTLMADVHVPADSRWFDGHFPGNPVLPGIAQLSMVAEMLGRTVDRSLAVRSISRVRFKQPIVPDDHLVVQATAHAENPGTYAFRITKHDRLVCNGTLTVATAGEQQE